MNAWLGAARVATSAALIFVPMSGGFAQVHVLAVTRASVAYDGAQSNGDSFYPSISADGRTVAFISYATNLVPGEANQKVQAYARDTQLGNTIRVSASSAGVQGNDASDRPSISGNGRYVGFDSRASNLVPGDTNGMLDVFRRDLESGMLGLVSATPNGIPTSASSRGASLSADGRYVAFYSWDRNLTGVDTDGYCNVFVRDILLGTTTLVSVAADGGIGNGHSYPCAISSDGRSVAFLSEATNLVSGDTNGWKDVFVRDLLLGTTTRVSVDSDGNQANGFSDSPSISADGGRVAFVSWASNLVSGDTNGSSDVFVRDLRFGTTVRASIGADGSQGNGSCQDVAISPNGRFVGFSTRASNFSDDDANGTWDIYVRDLVAGTLTPISVAADGLAGNDASFHPAFSVDGRIVGFESHATNLVAGDTNGKSDVFLAATAVDPTVAGKLILLDYAGALPSHAAFQFRDPLTGALVKTYDSAVAVDGSFAACAPNAGSWDLSVKIGHWLRKTLRVDATPGDVWGVEFRLGNGDVDGDNAITVFDYNLLSAAFDSLPGDANWDPSADLDGDGAVTVFDYNILSESFDKVGDA